MQTAIIEIINKFGYLGIVSLITIENLFPPIPSEVILTFGGFATTISNIINSRFSHRSSYPISTW